MLFAFTIFFYQEFGTAIGAAYCSLHWADVFAMLS